MTHRIMSAYECMSKCNERNRNSKNCEVHGLWDFSFTYFAYRYILVYIQAMFDTSGVCELVWRKEALKGIWGYFRPFFDR